MKKIIALFLALVILLSLVGCTGYGIVWDKRVFPDKTVPEVENSDDESVKSSCTPLLYKVSDENENIVYRNEHYDIDVLEVAMQSQIKNEDDVKQLAAKLYPELIEVLGENPYMGIRVLLDRTIKFIVSKWELLCREIDTVFKNDIRRRIIELSVSSLRFWIANPNYRSVLMTVSPSGIKALSLFDNSLVSAIREWCVEREQDFESKKYTVLALIYGSLMLLDENYDGLFLADKLRGKLEEEFQN